MKEVNLVLDIMRNIENGKKPNVKKHSDEVTMKVPAQEPILEKKPKVEVE